MNYINRLLEKQLVSATNRGKSILLLGPRQTGKTTMIQHLDAALRLSLIQPRTRLRYEKDPSLLADEILAIADAMNKPPLVIVDEIQKVPLLMDVAQDLIDNRIAQFILTGSSARKLRRGENINLLPGRVIPMQLCPLTIEEIPAHQQDLQSLLLFGSLPAVINGNDHEEKEEILDAYVSIYLEEEIRAEAVVRDLGEFARFLELAAGESGNISNYSKLSQQIGVARTTIADYYQILEDCLVAERIEPLTTSNTRHKLSKSQKYILFDLGVRRIAAREGQQLPLNYMGHLFEQFVILEFIRKCSLHHRRAKVLYWRDHNGPEVDCVIEKSGQLIPVEVKYTDAPGIHDARHLITFLAEYNNNAEAGYIVCQTPRKMKLANNIYALPWQEMLTVLEE